jgi:hypothetical protein
MLRNVFSSSLLVIPSKPKKKLNEFEKALLEARNKLKATEDKLEERVYAIETYGYKSTARASTPHPHTRM